MNSGQNARSEEPARESALHYEGAEEPRISIWPLIGVIALFLATGYYAYRLAHG
jgi:hypothetical protein